MLKFLKLSTEKSELHDQTKMTYEDYCTNGYYYRDYIKLSQWQRWRGIRQQRKMGKLQRLKLVGLWQVRDEGYVLFPFPLWLNPRRWSFGFDSSQTWEELGLGFFRIIWEMKGLNKDTSHLEKLIQKFRRNLVRDTNRRLYNLLDATKDKKFRGNG